MDKQVAIKLLAKCDEIQKKYSNADRECNPTDETFDSYRVEITSERSACVIYNKSSGKKAVAWCHWIGPIRTGYWQYFFVSYSHLVGLNRVARILQEVENHNWLVSVEGMGYE
jgi:hypothetical protein